MQNNLSKEILEKSYSGIFLYQNNRFVYANDELLNIIGYHEEELDDLDLFEHIHPDSRSEVKTLFNKISAGQQNGSIDKLVFQAMRKNGKALWLQLRPSSIVYEGQPALLGNMVEITERIFWDFEKEQRIDDYLKQESRRAREALEEKDEELEDLKENLNKNRKLAAIGKFSGNISHELKNPLAVIDGSARYLKRNLDNKSESVIEHLNKIRKNVKKSNNIIHNFKNLDNLDKSRFEKVELNTFIQDLLYSVSIPDSININTRLEGNNVFIKGKRNLLKIAFKNIIENAIEAMDYDGRLEIELKKADKENIRLSFIDNGRGIPEEEQDKIFQPMYTTRENGSGFGLHLVQKIIKGHEGRIEVESTPEEGTRFHIYIPYYFIV